MNDRVKSTHKNAARSRYLIKHAYGELLNEKDPSKISVTDIVERANISRGTFYAHYLDVYDLNLSVQNNVLEAMELAIDRMGIESIVADPTAAVTMGLEFLERSKDYYALFVNSSQGEVLVNRIVHYLEERFAPTVTEMFHGEELDNVRLFMQYTLGAYIRVITAWFNGRINMSAAEISASLMRIYLASRPAEVAALSEK